MRQSMRRLYEAQVPIDEEFRLRCKNASYCWFRGRGHAVWDDHGKPLHFAGSITDISGYKETELRLLYLADHDVLTSLPNRRLFLYRLCQGISSARDSARSVAVLFIDLDRFKPINDVLGHGSANQVVCEAAKRIRGSARDEATGSRLGGGEFTIVLSDVQAEAS